MDQSERVLANQDLKDVVAIAKQRGYKVYTFESIDKTIKQIFIEHTDGRIGSCSAYFGGINFFTMHKPVRGSGNGSGFGRLIEGQDSNNPQDLDVCFSTYPYWSAGHVRGSVEKYKSFQEYVDQQKILRYFEI